MATESQLSRTLEIQITTGAAVVEVTINHQPERPRSFSQVKDKKDLYDQRRSKIGVCIQEPSLLVIKLCKRPRSKIGVRIREHRLSVIKLRK